MVLAIRRADGISRRSETWIANKLCFVIPSPKEVQERTAHKGVQGVQRVTGRLQRVERRE